MADSNVSHAQVPGGSPEHVGWSGVKVNNVRHPLTEEQIQENVRKMRAAQGIPDPTVAPDFGRQHGLSREFAMWCQRLEAKVLEQEKEIAELRAALRGKVPPHMRDLETRVKV
jgi:hypothetical protein